MASSTLTEDNGSMAEKEENRDEKEIKRCNVCLAPATKKCHSCQTRIYCGRGCQKADWHQHRKYCRPPLTHSQRLDQIKHQCQEFGIPLSRIESLAKDPNDIKSLEEAFESEVHRFVTRETGQDPNEMRWPILSDAWQLNDAAWEKLKALPLERGEEFAFSYQTAGVMNEDTGFLFWNLTVTSNATGMIRFAANLTPQEETRPTRRELDQLIYLAMAKPAPHAGRPCRPEYILFANRWGRSCTLDLIDMLWDKLKIRARLESREDAKVTAAQHGTDPEGYNFPKDAKKQRDARRVR